MKWIHFTDNETDQLIVNGGNQISQEEGGLFVYKYTPEFSINEAMEIWGRMNYLIIECDEALVELVQENPLEDRPEFDEYLIPYEYFNKIKVY